MKETDDESPQAVPRLCSEIQLFDLCDREVCGYKQGRFCTNQELLDRFERISEDDRQPALRSGPVGEGDEDEPEDDDAFASEGYDDEEGEGWEEE